MTLLKLQLDSSDSLVDQITGGFKELIDRQILRPGNKLPSIRKCASELGVSTFTVIEAYNRLIALHYVQARPGSGFYVAVRRRLAATARAALPNRAFDYIWLIRGQLQDTPGKLNVSTGRLPRDWNDQELIRRALKTLASKTDATLNTYGDPYGYLPLRQLLQVRLNEIGIRAEQNQIVLTQGATQALELIVRLLLKPGDVVFVDDPGYFNLFGNLQLHGVRLVGITRTSEGPDTTAVERLAVEHKPKLFITQSLLHNPTGTNIQPHVAFRLLRLAIRAGFRIIENDAYADLGGGQTTRLASLDQLNQVIYVSTFSKTISAAVRVGFLVCSRELAENITNVKLLSSITSAQLTERLIYSVLTEGHYRRHLERLRSLLGTSMVRAVQILDDLGFEIFGPPAGGKFIWVRHKAFDDSTELAKFVAGHDIILAPGRVFRPDLSATPWLRFNVAHLEDSSLQSVLKKALKRG